MLLSALPPLRAAPPPRLYRLQSKDPFGEWVNPHDTPEILAEIESLPNDFDASAAFIRALRPRESGPALQFWITPIARAHFLNAMLLRGERTIVEVNQALDLSDEKGYAYLPRWNVEFRKRRRDVRLQDGAGLTYAATVECWDFETATAQVVVEGYSNLFEAHHMGHLRDVVLSDPTTERAVPVKVSSLYRTAQIVELEGVEPAGVLALLGGLTKAGVVNLVPPVLRAIGGQHLIRLSDFADVVPPQRWRMTLEQARQRSNFCRCMFWDLHRGRCGLGNSRPDSSTCEDHEVLEENHVQ
jgi:hypothetical protein